MFEVTPKILDSKIAQHAAWLANESENAYSIVLSGSLVKDYDFGEADLSEGHFLDCHFVNCNFSNAVLEDVDFDNCTLEGCNFKDNKSKLIGFTNAKLIGCKFLGADWANIFFDRTTFEDCDFASAKMNWTRFDNSGMPGHDFSNTSLRNASFYNCALNESNFTNADLTGADFTRANCTKCDFTEANLERTNFTLANLTDVILKDVRIEYTVGNGKEIKSVQLGGRYMTYTNKYMWVDCFKFPIALAIKWSSKSHSTYFENMVDQYVDANIEEINHGRVRYPDYTREELLANTNDWFEKAAKLIHPILKAEPAPATGE